MADFAAVPDVVSFIVAARFQTYEEATNLGGGCNGRWFLQAYQDFDNLSVQANVAALLDIFPETGFVILAEGDHDIEALQTARSEIGVTTVGTTMPDWEAELLQALAEGIKIGPSHGAIDILAG